MKILILLWWLIASPAFGQNALRIQLAGEPNTLDPYHVNDVLGFNLVSNLQEGLLRINGEGKLVNGWSQEHKISKNGLEYRFRIKAGAKWSDGSPLVAEDFASGLEHALNPKTAARDASLLQSIKSVKAEHPWLTITLKQPDSSLLSALTMPLAGPLKKSFLKEGNWHAGAPSSGPYRLGLHKLDREILLEPNAHFPGARLPLSFRVIPEESTALNLFEVGELDILTTIPSTETKRVGQIGNLIASPSAASFYLSFNVKKKPFGEPRLRRVIAGAINRESLVKLQPDSLAPALGYLPSALPGAKAATALTSPEDLAWAKEQVKALGEVNLVYPASALASTLVQRLQNDLSISLGLKIKLEPLEWKAYLGRLAGDAPGFFYMGYSAVFNDAIAHLKLFASNEPDNRSQFKSAEYDRLLEIVKTKIGPARLKAVEKAAAILEQEAVVIPLLERKQLHGLRKGVQGFSVNPYGVMDLRLLRR
jgi:oligopeptide transport system substrate-binding protein